MILYGFWRSTATWRVRIALHYKRIAFEYRPVNLQAGEQDAAPHDGRNPMHQVPVLDDGGVLFTQSLPIIEYLDERHPEPPLVPRDPIERVRARELAEIVNSGMHPLQNTAVQNRLRALGVDEKAWVRGWVDKGLGALERRAQETAGRFLVGDAVSIADLCLVPQLHLSRRFAVDLAPYPTLLRIEAGCAALPAFQAAHADVQIDRPE